MAHPKVGNIAPAFTLQDQDGNKVSLKDFKGKTILLHFWATWCVPCKKELPTIQKVYEALNHNDFEVIAISIDRNNTENVKQYIKDYNFTVDENLNTAIITPDAEILDNPNKINPAYIVFENYELILKWNRSLRFALAVCNLKNKFKNEL